SSSRRCWTGRWPSASTRSAPVTTRGWRTAACIAAPTGPRTSPTCSPCSAGSSSAGPCSRSATRPRRRCGRRRRRAAWRWPATPASQDVSFTPDGDTRPFVAAPLGQASGPIVDTSGAVVGSHDGAYGFTVGQRRGLRVGTPAADGKPRYVLDIEPASGTVTVGPAESLDVTEIQAERPVWTGCPPPPGPRDCLVQLRAHRQVHPATVIPGDDLRIVL